MNFEEQNLDNRTHDNEPQLYKLYGIMTDLIGVMLTQRHEDDSSRGMPPYH